jgi:cobalt-zinc-cadmium efflux system protein
MSPHNHGDHSHHHHAHGPAAHRGRSRRVLTLAMAITGIFFMVEVVGAWITGSLALLADAGHMFTDVLSLGLALFANWAGSRAATNRRTYGWQRVEILAAFLNGIALLIVSAGVASEAIRRFANPPAIAGGTMIIVSLVGLLANLATASILFSESRSNLNVKAAFLHVVTDTLGSVGALIAAALIYFRQWYIADPILSICISILVLVSAWALLRECVSILLQSVPADLDTTALIAELKNHPGVIEVHDLHAWTMNTGFVVLTAHVRIADDADGDAILSQLNRDLKDHWHISHTTLQIERAPCNTPVHS